VPNQCDKCGGFTEYEDWIVYCTTCHGPDVIKRIEILCESLERLRLHAVNCREAQRNFEEHRTPMGLAAKIVAEEKIDALLKELKP